MAMPTETGEDSWAHVVVYTKSSLYEQTTPDEATIADRASTVGSVAFVDKDLDAGQMGGTLTWAQPADNAVIAHYVAYKA